MEKKVEAEQEELWRITHQVYSELNAKFIRLSNATEESSNDFAHLKVRLSSIDAALAALNNWRDKSIRETQDEGGPKAIVTPLLSAETVTLQLLEERLEELVRNLRGEHSALMKSQEEEITNKVANYISEIKRLLESRKGVAGQASNRGAAVGTTSKHNISSRSKPSPTLNMDRKMKKEDDKKTKKSAAPTSKK